MPHFTGKALYLNLVYGTAEYVLTGTVTPSSDYRSVSWEDSFDTVDITAGSDTDRDYLPTLRDASIDITLLDDGVSGSAIYRAFAAGNHGTLTIAPLGTAAGNPRYACWGFVQNAGKEFAYDGEVTRTYSLQKRGAWLYHADTGGYY